MDESRRFGVPVPDWTPPPRPSGVAMQGRNVRLERLDSYLHAADLHRANATDDAIWDYMPYGPFHSAATYHKWVRSVTEGADDPLFYALRDKASGRALGVLSFLRIDPNAGSIEVGHINFSPAVQGTRAATEAIYLLMSWVFQAGYRRFEWKCDALNLPSRRAAQRFGFSYEGVFRQATVYKGRNRDTAWFAVIDAEWPALRSAYEAWLSPSNFDASGQQRERLSDMTQLVRVSQDPAL
ncbi:MAG: RimJ/RimL family protein N-acetyltransferase [Sulfitobacter sp.]|jgi:RimJ/RimL family protein N-acetyltransferase